MIDIDINNQIMLVIAAFVILLLVGNVIYIIVKDRKKDKAEIEELMNEIEEQPKVQLEKVEEVEVPKPPVEVMETRVEEPMPQVELDETKEEIAFDEKKSEIEEMLEKMQKDLEAKSEDVVETFEKEQEEKSIISYQELLQTIHKEDNINKIEVKEPVLEEPLVVEEQIEEVPISATQRILNEEIVEPIVETKPAETQAVKKFKNTDFISPIYGKMEEHFEYPKVPSFQSNKVEEPNYSNIEQEETAEDVIEMFDRKLEEHQLTDYFEDFSLPTHMKIDSLEQTLDMPPISPKIKENEEFLQALKEFRKNLE